MAIQMLDSYQQYLEPAEPDKIAAELYTLQGHYWQQAMPESLMRAVANDYARLLGGYSWKVFQKACDEWKLSTEDFFPKIGQLKEILDRKKAKVEMKIRRLNELLENAA